VQNQSVVLIKFYFISLLVHNLVRGWLNFPVATASKTRFRTICPGWRLFFSLPHPYLSTTGTTNDELQGLLYGEGEKDGIV